MTNCGYKIREVKSMGYKNKAVRMWQPYYFFNLLIFLVNTTLTDMKNRPVVTPHPRGEQAGFSAFTPWGRGKKAEKPGWILICHRIYKNRKWN
jgi:hypothetical protein